MNDIIYTKSGMFLKWELVKTGYIDPKNVKITYAEASKKKAVAIGDIKTVYTHKWYTETSVNISCTNSGLLGRFSCTAGKLYFTGTIDGTSRSIILDVGQDITYNTSITGTLRAVIDPQNQKIDAFSYMTIMAHCGYKIESLVSTVLDESRLAVDIVSYPTDNGGTPPISGGGSSGGGGSSDDPSGGGDTPTPEPEDPEPENPDPGDDPTNTDPDPTDPDPTPDPGSNDDPDDPPGDDEPVIIEDPDDPVDDNPDD